jgi:CubicO group peptidase (beta-lactamase class C family)
MRKVYVSLISLALVTCGAAHAGTPTSEQQVDQLLAKWDHPDMPGCALAVIQDGKVIYKRGVGMADLEHAAPVLPTTSFHVASMSKQFTAFAIHLLAQDGKLSLDDDIRKYLPEMHDFGKTITIRHLLHHTSGLRDQWNLLALAGWRLDDVITEDDIFRMIQRQQALNFAPGKEFTYSNTGYTLLGMIVKRVSGQPLPAFAQQRIFAPLGMTHTQFHDNYGTLVPGRAQSYDPLPGGGYAYRALSYSNVGATSLFTTVEDLALWDRNFDDGRVGGKNLLTQMQTVGLLDNGRPIPYASGLGIASYRGLNIVEHGGADAGFRSQFLRFPDQHFTVVVLANAGDFAPGQLAHQIADIYLAKQLAPAPAQAAAQAKTAPHEVPADSAMLDTLVGDYALSAQLTIAFTKEDGQLMAQATGQPKFPLFAGGGRTFFLKVVDAQFTFDAPGPDGIVAGGVLHQGGRDMPAKRVARVIMSDAEFKAFEGEYYSDELHVLYTMARKNGKLTLSYSRGQVDLDRVAPTSFVAGFPFGRINYQCVVGQGCTGFTVDGGRVRNLQFTKVSISPAAAGEASKTLAVLPPLPAETAPPFETEAIYLRGSMNDWGVRDKMQKTGPGRYEVQLVLDKGRYEFKVGSDDFHVIDFGAGYHDEQIAAGKPKRLEATGSNLSVDVPKRATYLFVLDTAQPLAPQIAVSAR